MGCCMALYMAGARAPRLADNINVLKRADMDSSRMLAGSGVGFFERLIVRLR